jgi:TusA-related sulfurtransferase
MTEEKMAQLRKGDILEVLFTDPGAKPDLEAWCRATGNLFLDCEKQKSTLMARIQKQK